MLDDLYQSGTDAALNDLATRPLPQPTASPKFSVWNTIKAAPKGVAQGANESAGFWADVTGAFGQVAGATDARSSMFGSQTEAERQQEEQARQKLLKEGIDYTSPAGEDFRATAKDFMPDPTTAHTAEKVVGGLTRFITKAVGYSAAGGPVPGAALTGADEAFTTASDLKAKGVDLQTRTKVGAISGAAAAAGVLLPVSGSGVASTVALTAVGGPGMFVAQNAATREILQNAGYDKIGAQYDPFDPVGLAVSTLVPAGFGAWALRGAKLRAAGEIKPGEVKPGEVAPAAEHVAPEAARPTPDQVDAARVEMLTQHVESARLTPPEDVVGARAHDEAMARAMDQMARGERVEVSDVAPVPRVAQTETPEFKAWFGESKVVDEQGKPLVVYHGTSADVQAFDPGQLQAEGIHLTSDSSVANRYASSRSMDGGRGANVIPLYVKADRVLDVPMINTDAIKNAAASGFDAVRRGDHIVVMRPEQIKSAIGNSGKFDPSSPSLTDSRFASWADQINAAIADIRAAAKEAANVQGAPKAGTDAQPIEQTARLARPNAPSSGAAEPTAPAGGVSEPRPGAAQAAGVDAGAKAETAAHAARLAEIQAAFPDLEVMLDGMDKPAKLSEFLADIQRQAMEGTDMELGGNDAPLMQVAANCFLLNGG